MTHELKPCPFCGGEGVVQPFIDGYSPPKRSWRVRCDGCFAGAGFPEDDHEDAIETWNRRASPPPPVEGTDERAGKRIAPADVYRVLKRHYDEAPITSDDLPRLSREIAALTAIGAKDAD